MIQTKIKHLADEPRHILAPGTDMTILEKSDILSIDYIEMSPGSEEHEIVHRKTDEMIFIVDGEVEATIDGVATVLRKGDFIAISRGTRHMFVNATERSVAMISVCTPPFDEQDVFETERPADAI